MIAGLSLPPLPAQIPAASAAAPASGGAPGFAQALSAAEAPAQPLGDGSAGAKPLHAIPSLAPADSKRVDRTAAATTPHPAIAQSEAVSSILEGFPGTRALVIAGTDRPAGEDLSSPAWNPAADPRTQPLMPDGATFLPQATDLGLPPMLPEPSEEENAITSSITHEVAPSLQALPGSFQAHLSPTSLQGSASQNSAPPMAEATVALPAPNQGLLHRLDRLEPDRVATSAPGLASPVRDAVTTATSNNARTTAERSSLQAPPGPAADAGTPTFVALGTLQAPTTSPAAAAGAASTHAQPAAQAQISSSLHSAAFAPEFGAQICTFARHGVERAQLQLHPAEMGPVTVQVLVEGASAQVRLWAEQAPTRQALELAMPNLASQLRDSGLTLTGGGVFEQPRQTPDQARRETHSGAREAAAAPAEPAPLALVTPVRRRGVVDLIA